MKQGKTKNIEYMTAKSDNHDDTLIKFNIEIQGGQI